MELKEFVKDVLVQLLEGIFETQQEIGKLGAVVNPMNRERISSTKAVKKRGNMLSATDILFELGLTKAGTKENMKGIGGGYLANIAVGANEQ